MNFPSLYSCELQKKTDFNKAISSFPTLDLNDYPSLILIFLGLKLARILMILQDFWVAYSVSIYLITFLNSLNAVSR